MIKNNPGCCGCGYAAWFYRGLTAGLSTGSPDIPLLPRATIVRSGYTQGVPDLDYAQNYTTWGPNGKGPWYVELAPGAVLWSVASSHRYCYATSRIPGQSGTFTLHKIRHDDSSTAVSKTFSLPNAGDYVGLYIMNDDYAVVKYEYTGGQGGYTERVARIECPNASPPIPEIGEMSAMDCKLPEDYGDGYYEDRHDYDTSPHESDVLETRYHKGIDYPDETNKKSLIVHEMTLNSGGEPTLTPVHQVESSRHHKIYPIGNSNTYGGGWGSGLGILYHDYPPDEASRSFGGVGPVYGEIAIPAYTLVSFSRTPMGRSAVIFRADSSSQPFSLGITLIPGLADPETIAVSNEEMVTKYYDFPNTPLYTAIFEHLVRIDNRGNPFFEFDRVAEALGCEMDLNESYPPPPSMEARRPLEYDLKLERARWTNYPGHLDTRDGVNSQRLSTVWTPDHLHFPRV